MAVSRFGRLAPRGSRPPSERDWERSPLLEPRLVARSPELISDGGGLSFSPTALAEPSGLLDPEDPAVRALIVQINAQGARSPGLRAAWKQDTSPQPVPRSLVSWRMLARTDDEALFALGAPPQLLTVTAKRDGRRRTWRCIAVTKARPLRAARERIRASSWRLDPNADPDPGTTVLRVLVTEQTYAGAQRATGRVLAPDLHAGAEDLVLTMFVTPKPGFQVRAPNPETPVRVALPEPLGRRRLTDGALYEAIQGESS